ncbi:MAG: hypothetical protein WAQ28_08565 [Bacteroidia bacterium]
MKIVISFLLLVITQFAFSQNEGWHGTIKIKKTSDSCIATVLGYSGENFIKKEEIVNIKKVELSEECGYRITSFLVSYLSDNETRKVSSGTDILDNTALKEMKNVSLIKFSRIKGKSLTSNDEREFPPIIFKIID